MHVNWFYLFGVPFAISLLFLPLLFEAVERAIDRRRNRKLPRFTRMGYLPGSLRFAMCLKCGSKCARTRSLIKRIKGFDIQYTEFICTKCLPPPIEGK